MTKVIPPLDLSWLLMESPASTTHVGALLLFKKPAGRRPIVREIVQAYRGYPPTPPFNYVPELLGLGAPHFRELANWDAHYHIEHLIISNVAGVKQTRYLNGARLVGIYPVSALATSIGLNATLASYHDSMQFGFVANAAAIDDPTQPIRHCRPTTS